MINVVLFAVYTTGSVAGLILIKQWAGPFWTAWTSTTPLGLPILMVGLGAALYILSFLIWMVILARNELSIAYPIAVGLTLIFSTLGAMVLLDEGISIPRVGGMALMLAGIVLVAQS